MASRSASCARRSVGGDVLRGVGKACGLVRGKAAVAQPQPADQRAMHQQIGVAADRAGEMRVARQREAEMTDIVGAVCRLRLAAQHHLVDQRRFRRAGDAAQHAVEIARMHLVAGRQRDAQPVQEVAQGLRAFPSDGGAWTRYMQGWCRRSSSSAAATLASTMNSSISRWLSSRGRGATLRTAAVVVEHDLALRQIEIERAARGAARPAARGTRHTASAAAIRGRRPTSCALLHLLVGQARGAAHQAAAESMRRSCGHRASMCISTNRQPRSSSGRRLHQPLDSASGSIGTTRSGK